MWLFLASLSIPAVPTGIALWDDGCNIPIEPVHWWKAAAEGLFLAETTTKTQLLCSSLPQTSRPVTELWLGELSCALAVVWVSMKCVCRYCRASPACKCNQQLLGAHV